jgi:hypothetical protein
MNILGGYPQVSDAIIANNMFSHYNQAHISSLLQRAAGNGQQVLPQQPSSPQRPQQQQTQQQPQVPPYVQELAEQTNVVLHQARNLSVLFAWQARRDAARAAYLAAKEAMPRDFLLIADLGKQRDLVQAEALMLPLAEEDFLTLPARRAGLVRALEEQCEAATAEERFEELRCLAVLLKQLQGMDEIPAPPVPAPPVPAPPVPASAPVSAPVSAPFQEETGEYWLPAPSVPVPTPAEAGESWLPAPVSAEAEESWLPAPPVPVFAPVPEGVGEGGMPAEMWDAEPCEDATAAEASEVDASFT